MFSGSFFKMYSHISSTFSSTDGNNNNNKTTLNLNLQFHGVKMLRDNFQTLFRSKRIATWSVRSLKLAEQEAIN